MNSDGEGMIKGAMRIPSMWYMQRMIARKQDQDVYALYFLNVVVNLVQGVRKISIPFILLLLLIYICTYLTFDLIFKDICKILNGAAT